MQLFEFIDEFVLLTFAFLVGRVVGKWLLLLGEIWLADERKGRIG